MRDMEMGGKKVVRINTKQYQKDLKRNLRNPEFKAVLERQRVLHQVTRELRDRQNNMGLTQRELALEVGIGQRELSGLLTGTRNATIDTLAKVATGLGKELLIRLK